MKLLRQFLIILRRVIYGVLGFIDREIFFVDNNLFVLSYHSVREDDWRFSIDKSEMVKQLNYLYEHYTVIPLKTLDAYLHGKTRIDTPSVVITFDDGYKDILRLVPYFKRQKTKPALFILSDTAHPNEKELGTKRAFLSAKEIQELYEEGWEIGCHSATHANLSELSESQLEKEIVQSKIVLEKKLGFTIPYFAYPRGKYTKNVIRLVKKAKYRLAFTMDDGQIRRKSAVYSLPRIGIDRTHNFYEFTKTFSPSVVVFRQLIKHSPAGKYL